MLYQYWLSVISCQIYYYRFLLLFLETKNDDDVNDIDVEKEIQYVKTMDKKEKKNCSVRLEGLTMVIITVLYNSNGNIIKLCVYYCLV